MLDKKGSETVEAALVLPLVILTIAAFISLTVYCYRCLETQCAMQETLLERAAGETGLIQRFYETHEFSFPITGIDRLEFQRTFCAHLTEYDEDALVRAGGAVNGLFD